MTTDAETQTSPLQEERITALLLELTLEEKVGLLAGASPWTTTSIQRLGIPALKVTDDLNGARGGGGLASGSVTSAYFPVSIALAATWNTHLVEQVGAAFGEEARSKGAQMLLAPAINIHRSPLNSRNFECYSEDPFLSARMAVAYISGVQSKGVGATVKHFVCNDAEFERNNMSSEVDERALREIYLPPFRAAVQEAKPWGMMVGYNKVIGLDASESRALLTDILKHEWGFDGLVMSDWGGTYSTAEAVNVGLDLEMPGPAVQRGQKLLAAVEAGTVSVETIDAAARRILRVILRAGHTQANVDGPEQAIDRPEHRALARAAGAEAIVLLKNERGLLPLDNTELSSIAVIGPNAKTAQIMGGSSAQINSHYAVTPYAGVAAALGERVELGYAIGCTNHRLQSRLDEDALEQAVALAARADVALVFVGLTSDWESESFDRPDMELVGQQNELVEQVAAANPNTVVILQSGSPVTMRWIDKVAAVIQAWYPGQECGNAIADVLVGRVNPSGKLPQTFPHRVEDSPAFLNYPGKDGQVSYGEGLYVGYRWYERRGIKPLFPFGHGLSYTSFAYSNLHLSADSLAPNHQLTVSVNVTNTGSCAGQEVVQLYVRDEASRLGRPLKELKGFVKLALAPGDSSRATFTLNREALAYWDEARHTWVAEAGVFELLVGASSEDIRARASFQLAETMVFGGSAYQEEAYIDHT